MDLYLGSVSLSVACIADDHVIRRSCAYTQVCGQTAEIAVNLRHKSIHCPTESPQHLAHVQAIRR